MNHQTDSEEISDMDVVAQVHEVECDECGNLGETVRGLCDSCRCCEKCEHEFGPDDEKHSGEEGYVCGPCHQEAEDNAICGSCSGSGEGMWDGSTCRSCRGSGHARGGY